MKLWVRTSNRPSRPARRALWTGVAVAGFGAAATAAGVVLAGPSSHAPAAVAPAPPSTPVAASSPFAQGYWLTASDGGIFNYGAADFHGSTGAMSLNKPIVGMAATPAGDGYWLVASDGGIFSFGGAMFHGSTGAMTLNKPIVGMAATPSGDGYWLVASDGGIFAFGDALFHGSTGAMRLNKPIVGMAATPDGGGYWLVASDGGIFAFGNALFQGSTGAMTLNKPIVGMAANPDGGGYWLVASDGGIFAFGDSLFHGSTGATALNKPIVGMATSSTGGGYWLVASDGGIFSFGDATFQGSAGATPLNKPVVGMTAFPSEPPPAAIATSAAPRSFTADQGAAGISVTFTVTDVFGGGVPGVEVDFATTGLSGGSLVAPAVLTDAVGNATAVVHDTVAGDSGTVSGVVAGTRLNVTSGTLSVTTGHAATLAFLVQPSTTVSQATISPAPQVQVRDSYGNPVSGATNTITLALATNPGGGTLSGTLSHAAVNGVATFPGLSIDKAAAGYRLSASATGLSTGLSSAFAITPGAATKLGVITQPTTTASGAAITPAVRVAVQDAAGNTVTSATNAVTVALQNAPGATLSGTKTVAAVSGVATFANLTIDKAGSGYTLGASASGLTGATSGAFTVTPGAPSKLVFVQQPTNTVSQQVITPAVTVNVEDAAGNVVTSATTAVAMAIGTNPSTGTLSGTLTRNAVNGVATFNDLSVDKAGTGYALAATATGLTGAASSTFNITAGPATKLGFTMQPTDTVSQMSITPAPAVSVEDAAGNVVQGSTNSITVALGSNPGSGTLSGTKTVAASNGTASFPGLSIDKSGSGYTLAATASGLTGATSAAFAINPGSATKLVFTHQPSNVASGVAISPAVTVSIEDAASNVVTSATTPVTLAIGTNPSSGTLGGTTTQAAVSGVATFANLSVDKVGTGYTLTAAASGLPGATSTAFNVTPGAATQLKFGQQPTTISGGGTITPAPTVTVLDAAGNTVTSATNAVTVAIGTNPSGGTLSGTVVHNAVNGVATFSGLSVDKAGSKYTLTAAATGLSGDTSSTFDVTVGPVARVHFIVQPSAAASQVAIAPPVQAQLQDAGGNPTPTATNGIAVALTTPNGAHLNGTTSGTPSNGVVSFGNLIVDLAGTYTLTATSTGLTSDVSQSFVISAAAASKLVYTVQPSNSTGGVVIAPAVQVAIEDAQGNTATTRTDAITLSIGGGSPAGGTLSGTVTRSAVNGVASFNDLSIDKAGTGYTLGAAAGTLSSATSTAFNITVGPPAKLAVTQQPTTTVATQAITPAVTVSVEDAGGNLVSGATNSVTMAIGTNPSSGTLSGTLTQAASSGVATFSNLSIDKAGTAYTLTAAASGLTGATSGTFNITVGAATHLAFTAQPADTVSQVSIDTPGGVLVAVEDAGGNVVTSSTSSIAMAIGTNPSSGALSGTTPVNAVSGVASFTNLSIDKAGSGYTLTAAASGLTGATSTPFAILHGVANQLAFTVQPTNTVSTQWITPAVQVSVEDAAGNVVTNATSSITVAIGTGSPAGGTLSGTVTKSAVNGVATFANLSIDKAGTGYVLTASGGGVPSATSAPFAITVGSPAKLAFSAQPSSTVAGQAIDGAAGGVKVTILDAGGNAVTTATNSVAMAIGTNPASGTLSGTTTQAAVSGVATFADLSIDRAAGGYTLAATASGLTGATSNAFAITVGPVAKLAFGQPPTDVNQGAIITPAVTVQEQDSSGNLVTTATDSIQVAITGGGATLSGTKTKTAVNGVASFTDLSVNTPGQFTLTASPAVAGPTPATSPQFKVFGAPSKLVFTVQPTNTVAGAIINGGGTPVKVAIEDAGNNILVGATNNVSIATNNPNVTLSGTTLRVPSNGIATFNDLSTITAGTYTLVAKSTNLTSGTSSSFNVTQGGTLTLTVSCSPNCLTSNTYTSPSSGTAQAFTLHLVDQFGNNASGTVTLTLAGSGAVADGGTLSSPTGSPSPTSSDTLGSQAMTVTISGGTATFTYTSPTPQPPGTTGAGTIAFSSTGIGTLPPTITVKD